MVHGAEGSAVKPQGPRPGRRAKWKLRQWWLQLGAPNQESGVALPSLPEVFLEGRISLAHTPSLQSALVGGGLVIPSPFLPSQSSLAAGASLS